MASIAEAVLIASGARTGAATGDPFATGSTGFLAQLVGTPRVIEIVVDTTAFAAGSVTVSLEAYDEGAAAFKAVLTSAAIVATGTVYLRYGINAPNVTNLSAFGIPPKRWRVTTTGNGSTQTYSVSARVFAD